MNDSMKVKVAAAVTALFIGGIAAAGLITRSSGEEAVTSASSQPTVIHRKKVKTVKAPSAPATVPTASYVSAPAPAPVSTQVSPTGGGEYEDEDEDEGYEGEGESE